MKNLIGLFIALFIFLGNGVSAADAASEKKLIDACLVARAAFLDHLEEKSRYKWEFSEHVSDIRSYSMGVAETESHYIVTFRLISKEFKGGNWFYEIHKKTMKISRSYGFK